jgi:hypothetical protein
MTHEEGQSDRRYWDLLEAAPDGILEVSANGAIVRPGFSCLPTGFGSKRFSTTCLAMR